MKKSLFLFLLFSLSGLGYGQTLVYTYSLDTFAGRVDSFFLEETISGRLVSTGEVSALDPGGRPQTITNPIFFSDTAALTAFWQALKQDSINLAEKISDLQERATLLGAKYRAIWYVADSVFNGYTGGPKSVLLPPELMEAQKAPAPAPPEKPKKQKATTTTTRKKKKQ